MFKKIILLFCFFINYSVASICTVRTTGPLKYYYSIYNSENMKLTVGNSSTIQVVDQLKRVIAVGLCTSVESSICKIEIAGSLGDSFRISREDGSPLSRGKSQLGMVLSDLYFLRQAKVCKKSKPLKCVIKSKDNVNSHFAIFTILGNQVSPSTSSFVAVSYLNLLKNENICE